MEGLLKLDLFRQGMVIFPLAIILIIATYTDLKERKVYNKLTYPSVGIGLICHLSALGLNGLWDGLIGAAALFGSGLLLFILGAMRGGDVKLLTVVGAFLGWYSGFEVFFYAMLVGSIGGLIISAFNGYLFQMLKNVFIMIRGAIRVMMTQSLQVWEKPDFDERSWLPFSTWILIGAILTWVNISYKWPGLFKIFHQALGF